MSWRIPTEDDLLKKISGDELDALRAAALGQTQGDPVDEQIASAVAVVRGYIRANALNRMGPTGTLPEALIEPAMDYIAVPIASRVAGMQIDPESARATARRQAIRLFQDVATNHFAVEAPDDTIDDRMDTIGTPSISPPETRFSRTQQEGI